MQISWWLIGVGLLVWGLRVEGVAATLWSLVGTLLAAVLVITFVAIVLTPTGATIVATLAIAGATWRAMWWLTDRGHI